MAVSGIDGGSGGYAQGGREISAIELRIRQMEAQYTQAEASQAQESDEGQENDIENLEEQIARLERQLERAGVSPETTQAGSALEGRRQEAPAERHRARQHRFDTYEAQVTEPSAGLYRPVWDQEGRPGVELIPFSEGAPFPAPEKAEHPQPKEGQTAD